MPCVAKDGKHVERVLLAVAKAEPEIVAALGAALPEYRTMLAWSATKKAGATAAAIALTPLPILDVFPLLAVQASLVLGIARIYGQRITLARARELVVTFGLGFLGRTLFQELSKLGGPPGWVLSAAIASSTTVVMGRAAAVWFERGERAKPPIFAPRVVRSRSGCCSPSRRWGVAARPAKPCSEKSRLRSPRHHLAPASSANPSRLPPTPAAEPATSRPAWPSPRPPPTTC